MAIYLKKKSSVYDVEAGGHGGMLADGLPELDLNIDNAEEASADDNDDGCPGNAENGLENENYVRESAINNLKHKPIYFFPFLRRMWLSKLAKSLKMPKPTNCNLKTSSRLNFFS